MDTRELYGLRYRCLEDCGFCCTFTPEVAHDELARLRSRFPRLPLTRTESGMRLAFQGGCGACTLLSRRACTAYELRPAHCRYFPFHVYFGRRAEVYVNRACRGVEADPAGNLEAAFQAQVMAVAKPHSLLEHERRARKVHAGFRSNAEAAGAWGEGDVDGAARQAALDPALWEALPWDEAWAPFVEADVVARPFHLDGRLRWLTFEDQGAHVQAMRMEENGTLEAVGGRIAKSRAAPPPATRRALAGILQRLLRRDHFAGTVFDAVDASGYTTSVAAAATLRVRQVAADLAVRAGILAQLDVPVPAPLLAGEVERFYDSAFLDAPTIGGWL